MLSRKLKTECVSPDLATLVIREETSQDSTVAKIAMEGKKTACCGGAKRMSYVNYFLGLVIVETLLWTFAGNLG